MWVVIIITWNIINVCIYALDEGGREKIYGTLRREFIVCLIYLPLWTPLEAAARFLLESIKRWQYQQSFKVEGEICSRKLLNVTVILILDSIHSAFHAILCNHFSILTPRQQPSWNRILWLLCICKIENFHLISTAQYFHSNFGEDTNNRIIFRNGTCVTNFVYMHKVHKLRQRERMSDLSKHTKVINYRHVYPHMLKLCPYLISTLIQTLETTTQEKENSFRI